MIAFLLKKLIRFYQIAFSPLVGHNCRFIPTCSNYGLEAIEKFGALKGGYLTICRILRCNPFGQSGLDEVPEKFSWRCGCGQAICRKSSDNLFTQTCKEQKHHGK